jgi:hypothetical protein
MDTKQLQDVVQALQNIVQNGGINLTIQSYLLIVAINFIGICIAVCVGAYLKKRLENYAEKQDFDKFLERASETAKATKEIEENIRQYYKFIETQLNNFYAPLVSRIKQIRTLTKITSEIEVVMDLTWREEYKRLHAESDSWNHDEAFKPYRDVIEYNNKRFKEIILPLYNEMLAVFTTNYQLAEESTREYYQEFCRFVELWRLNMSVSLPSEALEKLNIIERPLMPFYEHLEALLKSLTSILASRKDSSNSK